MDLIDRWLFRQTWCWETPLTRCRDYVLGDPQLVQLYAGHKFTAGPVLHAARSNICSSIRSKQDKRELRCGLMDGLSIIPYYCGIETERESEDGHRGLLIARSIQSMEC